MPGMFFFPLVLQNGEMGEAVINKSPKNHDHGYELSKARSISTLKDLMLLFSVVFKIRRYAHTILFWKTNLSI